MLSPKSPKHPSPALLPYPSTPNSCPWRSPVLGHIKFAGPRGLSSQWWPTRSSSATYAARDTSSGGYWCSYCCSTYRVADPFSSLGTFFSSSIGGPCVPSNRCLWASTSIFAMHWHSLIQDSYNRVPSAKSFWHCAIVSGFGGWLWDGPSGGAVSG